LKSIHSKLSKLFAFPTHLTVPSQSEVVVII
jgi:hypothetical protein